MPSTAIDGKMDLIVAGDTAKEFVVICGVWCRFKLNDGSYSWQHLISRSLLGDKDSTIPKDPRRNCKCWQWLQILNGW